MAANSTVDDGGDDEGQRRSFTEVGGCNRWDIAETRITCLPIENVFDKVETACLWSGRVANPFWLEDNHHSDLHGHALVGILGSNLKTLQSIQLLIYFTRGITPTNTAAQALYLLSSLNDDLRIIAT